MAYARGTKTSIEKSEEHRSRQRRADQRFWAKKRALRVSERVARVEARNRHPALDCAWAAGLFEGEGTVTLNANVSMRVRPVVTVSNTDRDVVDFFQTRWPGSIRSRMPVSKTGNCRIVHNWTINAGEAIENFIRDVLPFIRTKRVREKMEIVLEDIVDRFANVQHGRVYERSLERMAIIRKLNHRGLAP